MRSIKELTENQEIRVYVYLKDDETGKAFLKQAEAEGFTYGDGARPTERQYAEVMAINGDGTINFVGANGRIAFGLGAPVGGRKLLRVDYAKYAAGASDYLYHDR